VLGLAAAVLILLAPGFARLRLRIDGRALVPAGAAEVAADRGIREEFGVEDAIVAVVETRHADGILNPETLAHVVALTRGLTEIPGVRHEEVLSLATEPGDRVRPGSLDFLPWLEPLPKGPAEMAALGVALGRVKIYRGTLLSTDSPPSATAVLLEVGPGADRQDLCRRVREAVAASDVPGDRVHLVGAPVAEIELGAELLRDLALLVPLAFAVMGAILLLFFRDLRIAALVLAGVGACLFATLALLGWSGAPVYLTCLVLPVFLTAVGVAESIHVCDRWLLRLERDPARDPKAALREALRELSRPVLHAALTTALAFLSFALSPLPAVGVLGVSMAVGVLLCLLWTFTALPAALALLGRRGPAARRRAPPLRARLSSPLERWTRRSLARPALALLPAAVLAAVAVAGAARVRVQDSWVDGLSPGNDLRLASRRVDELFGGTHVLRIRLEVDAVRARGVATAADFDERSVLVGGVLAELPEKLVHQVFVVKSADIHPIVFRVTDARIESGSTRLFLESVRLPQAGARTVLPQSTASLEWELDARDRWLQVPMLAELSRLEEFLAGRAESGVGAVIGPWGHLSTISEMFGVAEKRKREVLSTTTGIGRSIDLYLQGRGERRLREVLSADRDRALVTVLVRGANYVSVGKLLDEVRSYERDRLAPLGVRLAFGGDLATSQAMIAAIARTQTLSIAFSLAGVIAVVTFLTRSLAAGALCALPCAMAVLLVYGAMGWFAIPLGVATSMFAGMAIGVGDDFAIHLRERFKSAGKSPSEAVGDVGPAILVDASCVGAGFSVLAFSRVPTNARLGLLLVLAILGCVAATLHVLPVLLRPRPPLKAPGG